MRVTGTYRKLGNLSYFLPHALPPKSPSLQLTPDLLKLYGEASFALGQLNETGLRLPDANRFIKAYVIKEALLSSSIEGIHTTLIDVYSSGINQEKINESTQLVINYTKALEVSLSMLQGEGLPLATRVLRRAHEALLFGRHGAGKAPGTYRRQSVRVGELVPPPASEVPRMISDVEKYINASDELPPLIRAGLVHVQFETIHPFLDGNGRIGRLLIVLMLLDSKLLALPILYPSYFFKKHHLAYYQRLDAVRTKGDFEGWIEFYLRCIRDSALDAHRRASVIEELEREIKHIIAYDDSFRKVRDISRAVLDHLFSNPITNVVSLSKSMGRTYNTISNRLQHFSALGIVSQHSVTDRSSIYRFDRYLDVLEKEF